DEGDQAGSEKARAVVFVRLGEPAELPRTGRIESVDQSLVVRAKVVGDELVRESGDEADRHADEVTVAILDEIRHPREHLALLHMATPHERKRVAEDRYPLVYRECLSTLHKAREKVSFVEDAVVARCVGVRVHPRWTRLRALEH